MTPREIAERALGKPLPKGAEVHHVNCDPTDNRPSNLVICQDKAYHHLLHRRMRERGYVKPASAPINYIIRDIDDTFWRRVKAHAAMQGITVRTLILNELTKWIASDR